MADIELVVVGSSAGGVMALRQLVAALPADFETPVFIVQHLAHGNDTYLPDILSNAGTLPVIHPQDGMKIKKGTIYVAPPNFHMLLESGHILVKKGPKENRFRPSIDTLFRSAAHAYGPQVIGVILTGLLDDGCAGMWAVERMGGITIVQDPEQALYPNMPRNVLKYVDVDHVCALAKIGPLLVRLTTGVELRKPDLDREEIPLLKMEVDIAALRDTFDYGTQHLGEPAPLTCPECGGALHSFTNGTLVRYRCHTGHAFSSASLLEGVNETTEQKLFAALRSLEEAVMIVEKQAAVLQSVTEQSPVSHSIKIRALKRQVGELHNFLNHYLQFSEIQIDN